MGHLETLMEMRGKRALITGAAGGLGRVICETLAELGADLVLVDRHGTDLSQQADDLRQDWKIFVDTICCDLESQADRDSLVERVLSLRGDLQVLVNNAAFVGTSELEGWAVPFEKQTVGTWRRAIEVNLTAAFDLSKQFAVVLRKDGAGVIVNVGSIYGMVGPNWGLYEGTSMANPGAYAASKGGLEQLTRWLATTLAPDIRANCISPGGIYRNQPGAFVSRYVASTPMGRMATENDFRGAFAYFASDLSKYVTGQNLAVDGGWTAW